MPPAINPHAHRCMVLDLRDGRLAVLLNFALQSPGSLPKDQQTCETFRPPIGRIGAAYPLERFIRPDNPPHLHHADTASQTASYISYDKPRDLTTCTLTQISMYAYDVLASRH